MKIAIVVAGLSLATGAQAMPLSVSCHQDITETGYTMTGHPIPTQHIATTVHYVIDFAAPSLSVTSRVASSRFTNNIGGQHIIVDRNGMTIAGTTRFPNDGPITSQIMHFSADGTRGDGERKLVLHGRLLQVADTKMRCIRAG